MTTFDDLRAFQRALDLMVDVYQATETFPRQELYGLISQMRRASCSVVSHIAEAQGRLTFGERRQLLSQGRGSLFEVEAQVIASVRLGFIAEEAASHLRSRARIAAQELDGLLEWVKRREAEVKSAKTRKPQKPDA
jgi:four helix bundle protein